MKPFTSLESCQAWLGCKPVLSRLGLITKESLRPNGQVEVKRRLILDCKSSQVNAQALQNQRILLPVIISCL